MTSRNSVARVMRQVLLALVPGIMAMIWSFGWGVLLQLVIASLIALSAEALMLTLRQRPLKPFLTDSSVVVTAWLLALSLPPLAPWWVNALGTAFAVVIAKHLYGGLGYNLFNPAMAGYAAVLVSFPIAMTHWPAPTALADPPGFWASALIILTGHPPAGLTWDAITQATPLAAMQVGLNTGQTIDEIQASPLWGDFGGRGWEWIGNWYLVGGAWLLVRRVITWHIPVGVIGGLLMMASLFFIVDPGTHPFPAFHLFSGGAILGAFFIATDPVSASTTPRGRLIYGIGIGVLIHLIRTFGGYPDGVAFAVLLMNMAVPLIDAYTRRRTFGH